MGAPAYGKGTIYAALFDNGLVKIGLTRKPENRSRTLAAQGPAKLLHFVTTDVDRQLFQHERELHNLFKEKRVRGEFFEFEISDWVKFFTYWGNLNFANVNCSCKLVINSFIFIV